MSRADLHCHSRFSNHPSEWFLKRLGSAKYEAMRRRSRVRVTTDRDWDRILTTLLA